MMAEIDLAALQQDFIAYAKHNTRSDATSTSIPTTPGQTVFAQTLAEQLTAMGLVDVYLSPSSGFLSATLPSNVKQAVPSIGFIAHLDTADYDADNVQPQVHPDYNGDPIVFDNGLHLTVEEFPALKQYLGETLITGDGTTLLGVDDKAGIAGAMAAMRYLLAHPEVPHGELKVAFGPDEEIGRGANRFDADGFATDFAYTLDNGDLGQIEYETFNAAQATVTFSGTAVHPGNAKGLMVNALSLAQALDNALPQFERPEFTSDYAGYFHRHTLSGTVTQATAVYLLRDFDQAGFAARKQLLLRAVAELNAPFDQPRIQVELVDQYYNMAPVIDQDRRPLTLAEEAIKQVGLTPTIVPFRGGTDGSKITYLGIPTPNLFNGGINFHGPYEAVSTEAMGKLAETLVAIATMNVTGHV